MNLFLAKNVLITIQEEPDYDVFGQVRERLRSGRGMIRKSKADYLAHVLIDSIIDHYYPVLEKIGADIDELEDQLLQHPTRDMMQKLHEHKGGLTQLRRFVWPMREASSFAFCFNPARMAGQESRRVGRDWFPSASVSWSSWSARCRRRRRKAGLSRGSGQGLD